MSSTTVPDALRDVLTGVATHPGVPADYLALEQYETAGGYEYRGQFVLMNTGAVRASTVVA